MPFIFRSRITVIGLVLLIGWLGVGAVGAFLRAHSVRRELAALTRRINDAQRENGRLGTQIQQLQQPSRLALLARQRLNYKMPDEQVAFVYKTEKSGIIAQPVGTQREPAHWKKWWDWLKGE